LLRRRRIENNPPLAKSDNKKPKTHSAQRF
jgi:hypothetical protein